MRINFYGGPGTGKSTTATWLFSELKLRSKSVEYIHEYAKFWAYDQRKIHKFDQTYLFGKQMQNEYRYLTRGVKNIITDSPVLLAAVYAEVNGSTAIAESLAKICQEYDNEYPALDILLERGDKPYVEEGRYQTRDQAMHVDELIQNYLARYLGKRKIFKSHYQDRDRILKRVLEVVK